MIEYLKVNIVDVCKRADMENVPKFRSPIKKMNCLCHVLIYKIFLSGLCCETVLSFSCLDVEDMNRTELLAKISELEQVIQVNPMH